MNCGTVVSYVSLETGHDEALESAEIASQRCMKSVMSEMNASDTLALKHDCGDCRSHSYRSLLLQLLASEVMTAEARAQQQCARRGH